MNQTFQNGATVGENIALLGAPAFDELAFKPEAWIYIFTVARRAFDLSSGAIPRLHIPGRAENERYRQVATIPHPFYEVTPLEQNGKMIAVRTSGGLVAMDLLNPDNLTGNQDFDTSANAIGQGTDYNRYGVFWSTNNPPQEQEIVSAERRRARFQQKLVDQVLEADRTNPQSLSSILTPDHREAMDELGIETAWHKKRVAKETCPNCGESINVGAKFHFSEALRMICVRPSAADWHAAVLAGVKQAGDVPLAFREEEPPEDDADLELPRRGPGRPRTRV